MIGWLLRKGRRQVAVETVGQGVSVQPTSLDEAREARRRAELARDEAVTRSPEVRRVAANLRQHRVRNHFAESLGDIFKE
jgi:hypothetical protein